jgi:hypothetical protein
MLASLGLNWDKNSSSSKFWDDTTYGEVSDEMAWSDDYCGDGCLQQGVGS